MKESYLSPLLNAWALDKNIIKWKELVLVSRFLQGFSRPMISSYGRRDPDDPSLWKKKGNDLHMEWNPESPLQRCFRRGELLCRAPCSELLSTDWHPCSISKPYFIPLKFWRQEFNNTFRKRALSLILSWVSQDGILGWCWTPGWVHLLHRSTWHCLPGSQGHGWPCRGGSDIPG